MGECEHQWFYVCCNATREWRYCEKCLTIERDWRRNKNAGGQNEKTDTLMGVDTLKRRNTPKSAK